MRRGFNFFHMSGAGQSVSLVKICSLGSDTIPRLSVNNQECVSG